LKSLQVNGFPIIDHNERVLGMISRDYIITLIKNEMWYDETDTGDRNSSQLEDYLKQAQANRKINTSSQHIVAQEDEE
jgi:hypothetical protein